MNGYGEANGIPGKAIKFDDFEQSTSYTWWYYTNTLAHEIGHCLGLCHTVENCYCMSDINYIQEATPGGVCNTALDSSTSNNIIAQVKFGCNKYLSPRQLEICHSSIRNTFLFNTLTLASQHYVRTAQSNNDLVVTSNQTWLYDRYMKGNIIVPASKTLTIKCKVLMQENGRIIVQKGGRLVVDDGEITNIYGKYWRGIEVEGDNSVAQGHIAPTSVQGYVRIVNGSVISNAKVGVSNCLTNAGGFCIFSTNGGIIQAANSNFLNNLSDASFFPYVNSTIGNDLSYFSSCSFKVTVVPTSSLIPGYRVSLFQVKGVRFASCDFENTVGAYGPNNRGFAIQGFDAGFTVEGSVSNKTKIKGFETGITASSINPLNTVSIKNTEFNLNWFNSVRLYNMYTPVVEQNDFLSNIGIGLYLDNCKYYNVRNNNFVQNPAHAPDDAVGLYVNNSQDGAHSIYRNNFSNMSIGIGAMYDNSGLTNTADGLKMNCNDFTTGPPNWYDIALMGTSPTAANVQGSINGPVTDLVRNRYSAPTITNGEVQWYIQGTSAKSYLHGSNSDANTKPTPQPAKSDVMVNVLNSSAAFNIAHCPSGIPPVCPMPCFFGYINPTISAAQTEVADRRSVLTATVDGGNTQSLLNTVYGNADLRYKINVLTSKSPYLSDTVLSAYFLLSGITNANLRTIYDLNKPVSVKVWNTLLSKNLSANAMQYLANQQATSGVGARAMLEAMVINAEFNVKSLIGEKISYCLTDTLPGLADSLIQILDTNVAKWKDAGLIKFYAYLNKGDLVQAAAVSESIALSNEKTAAYFNTLMAVYSKTQSSAEVLDNTQTINFLTDYANDSTNFGHQGARSLLNGLTGYTYYIPYLKPVTNGYRMANETPNNEVSEVIFADAKIFPNPTNGNLNVLLSSASPEEKSHETITISMTDLLGRLLHHVPIQYNSLLELDLSTFPAGMYLLTIQKNNRLIYHTKISKIQ